MRDGGGTAGPGQGGRVAIGRRNTPISSQVLKREKDWMTYMYDFGDSWEHKVTLQKILPYDPAVRLPACISGRRRCPAERPRPVSATSP